MKKGTVIGIILVIFVVFGGFYGCSKRNDFVEKSQTVKKAAGNMQVQYQRRMDLIDQLVETVKGQKDFEQTTLTGIVNARASATQVKLNMDDLTPESIQKYKAAQGEISQALGRLLSITENYPDLKTNGAFSELRTAIEGTENRISTARTEYNDAVTVFNTSILKIPGSLFAWGYKELPTFEADAGAEKAPKIKF
jgi:LemA protein